MRLTRKRKDYRRDASAALSRIEARRKKLGVSREALAFHADMSERTLRRMISSGCGFPRKVRALTFALRTIERERLAEDEAMCAGSPPATSAARQLKGGADR